MTGTPFEPLRPNDPQTLGNYRLAGRIGRGGMGVVYAAYGPGGERVAVKVINPELADDESFRGRFRREVEAARRVRQFCTAPVLDAQLEGDPLYIVTEYIEGPDLNDFLHTQGAMRGSSLEHLSVGVATALAAIHGAGIVHRDLKPANVLLSPFGPRVIDFGIARALDGAAHVTKTGQFIGTPSYMAPELIEGGQGTPASDVFAWGCLVVHAATGKPPFSGPTLPAIFQEITKGTPNLEGLDDPALRAVVERALHRDPAQRPSAQELLNLLVGQENVDTAQIANTVDRGWTEVSQPVTSPDVVVGVPESRTALLEPQTAVAGASFGAPPPVNGMSHPPTQAAAPDGFVGGQQPPRRFGGLPSGRWVVGAAVAAVVVLLGGLVYALQDGSGPPSAVILSSDDFGNPDSGWNKENYKNGALQLTSDGIGNGKDLYARSPFNGIIPDRMLVSVQVTLGGRGTDDAAIICDDNVDNGNNTHGYVFRVRVDGDLEVSIWSKDPNVGNKAVYGAEQAPGYRRGQPNLFQVACEKQGDGMRLRFWINGTQAVDRVTRTPVDPGSPALYASVGGDQDAQGSVAFRHFQFAKITG